MKGKKSKLGSAPLQKDSMEAVVAASPVADIEIREAPKTALSTIGGFFFPKFSDKKIFNCLLQKFEIFEF